MRTDTTKEHRRRKGAFASALAATIMAAVATTGCGGAQSPPAVHLALTAPTEGAAVNVSKIKVFGTVDPPSAAVTSRESGRALRMAPSRGGCPCAPG